MLESLNHVRGHSLDSLYYVNVSFVLGSPELVIVLQVWPHQCSVEGKDHLPQSAGYTPPSAAQDTFRLCSKGTSLAHVQLRVCQDLRAFSAKQPSTWVALSMHWWVGFFSQGLGFAIPFVELHEVPVGSFLQPVKVLLDGSMTLWCRGCHSSQFGVICKHAEGILCTIIQIINEDVKEYWTQY